MRNKDTSEASFPDLPHGRISGWRLWSDTRRHILAPLWLQRQPMVSKEEQKSHAYTISLLMYTDRCKDVSSGWMSCSTSVCKTCLNLTESVDCTFLSKDMSVKNGSLITPLLAPPCVSKIACIVDIASLKHFGPKRKTAPSSFPGSYHTNRFLTLIWKCSSYVRK